MKTSIYSRLAVDGIRKNKKLYIPNIITSVGTVTVFFIMSYLSQSDTVHALRGGTTMCEIMILGSYILALFSAIILFYSESFLMRRRKKEFGLYNIMGMSKRKIQRIIIREKFYLFLVSVISGIALGTLLSKLSELVVTKIMHGKVSYSFSIMAYPYWITAALFAVIYFLIFLNSVRQVSVSNPVELIRSENRGEKAPKGNIILAVLGVVFLGAGYGISLAVKQPIEALMLFFVAVILVIIGTYLMFISGSVFLCRLLKKNKNYYYKPNHFASVSSMMFRMKRNGAGLASICILSTMVLVMIAGSASLYFGSEDALRSRYPYDVEAAVKYEDGDSAREMSSEIRNICYNILTSKNYTLTGESSIYYATITGYIRDDMIYLNSGFIDSLAIDYSKINSFMFIEQSEYERLYGDTRTIKEDEALIYNLRSPAEGLTQLNFECGTTLNIIDTFTPDYLPGGLASAISGTSVVVVKDFSVLKKMLPLTDSTDEKMLLFNVYSGFNLSDDTEKQIDAEALLADALCEIREQPGFFQFLVASIAMQREDFYGTFGGILILGIMLSMVFMFATVLIIYYKQVTEGYEDNSRFAIMRKIGMTKELIRKSINS